MKKKTSILLMLAMLISMYFLPFINSVVIAIENEVSAIIQFEGTSGIDDVFFTYENGQGELIGKAAVRLDTSDNSGGYFTPQNNEIILPKDNGPYRNKGRYYSRTRI